MEIFEVWHVFYVAPHADEFAGSHAMACSDGAHADKGTKIVLNEVSLCIVGVDGIGTVEEVDFEAAFEGGLRQKEGGIDERVIACADVLDIDDDGVEVVE